MPDDQYTIFRSKTEPLHRVMQRPGAGLHAALVKEDWKELGPIAAVEVPSDIREKIAAQGFFQYKRVFGYEEIK